jgi:hypothetical protein
MLASGHGHLPIRIASQLPGHATTGNDLVPATMKAVCR